MEATRPQGAQPDDSTTNALMGETTAGEAAAGEASTHATAAGPAASAAAVAASAIDLDRIEADLVGVEAALARLDAGTYDIDEVTGQPLDENLLAANPIARRAEHV